MGTINMFQLPCSPPRNFLPWFFSSRYAIIFFSDPNPSLSFPLPSVTPSSSSRLPQGRAGQSVSRRGPPVPYSSDSHLGRVSSRQPGPAGTVGAGQAFPGEPQNVNTPMKFCSFFAQLKKHFHTLHTAFTGSTVYYMLLWCQCYCRPEIWIRLIIHASFFSPSVDVQPPLQQETGGWGRSSGITAGC